eukprot:Lankesteria_metandrocarpae@DN3724_c0_g1_i2.p1
MRRIFGADPKQEPSEPGPTLQDASGRLSDNVTALDAKITACDAELLRLKKQLARFNSSSARQQAVTVLTRKKMYEQQRNQLLGAQFNIDQTLFTTEQLQTSTMAASAMRTAATALKQELKQVNLSNLEALQDDLQDCMLQKEEIDEVLGRNYSMGVSVDEEALEQEFALLSEEMLNESVSVDEGSQLGLNATFLKIDELPPVPGQSVNEREELKNLKL